MPEIFFVFLLSGFIMGAVYDFFRFLRLLCVSKVFVFFADFIYFVIFSFSFFIPLLAYNNGSVRVMYFTVYLLGFIVYLASVFRLTAALQRKIAFFIRNSVKKALKSFKKVLQFIKRVYYNEFVKHLTFTKKLKVGKKAGNKNENASSEIS